MKLVIIEDQAMIRQLLVMAFKQVVPEAEVFAAADGAAGVAICEKEQPDLVTLDLMLPDRGGLEIMPDIQAVAQGVKIVVLSSHVDEFTLHRLQRSGVNGIVDKNMQTLDVLRDAITTVLSGGAYNCQIIKTLVARMRADPLSFEKVLSEREIELLCLFGRGWSNEQVAQALDLSVMTARNHRQNIMKKLALNSTPQMMRYAFQKGFARILV